MNYNKQHRGNQAAYKAYFAGMNSSMQQKVALTTAHFPVRGRIADMGSGSGQGTYDLACLYEGLELVGIDINPVSVQLASEKFKRSNLSYQAGDISQMLFPENSLDGILDSSVLHHVTSFNDFDVGRVLETFDNQVAQLKTGGVIIVRDFVIPDGPDRVYLDLPVTDGKESGGKQELSSAALFEVFAQTWRSSVNPKGPVAFIRTRSPRDGFARFEITLRVAAEFVLRKDYRADWETEVLEEYTYLSQSQFEEAFRARGLRVVTSRPLWNPWIVQNRFKDKFYLADMENDPLPYPPTNYLVVGEKVRSEDGVELVESKSAPVFQPKFLRLTSYRHKPTQQVFELVERPHTTVDVLPWFESEGQLFVLAKKDFPRPIVNASRDQSRLDGASLSGYITEPISAIVEDRPFAEIVATILKERAGLSAHDLLSIDRPFFYYTSPGAINERVKACLVKVRNLSSCSADFPNYTPFQSAGSVRELDALQVLRASNVGGMFDARLEINIYRLLEKLGRSAGPWIGAPLSLSVQPSPPARLLEGFDPGGDAEFVPAEAPAAKFLSIRAATFEERAHKGEVISEVVFEYVTPQELSLSTVVAFPVMKTRDQIFVGIELRNLPVVQSFTGCSAILTVPAWRVPRIIRSVAELPEFVERAMEREFDASLLNTWELGGPYFASPGVTSEVVYPLVVEVQGSSSNLGFVALEELRQNLDLISDAHLLIAAHRLIHAMG